MNQLVVRQALAGVVSIALFGLVHQFIGPSSGSDLGLVLLVLLSVALSLLFLRLLFIVKGRSITLRVAGVLLLVIIAIAYCSMIYIWSVKNGELAVYSLLFAILYIGIFVFSLWLIYALKGWVKIAAVLVAALAALVAGWNLFWAAFAGSF